MARLRARRRLIALAMVLVFVGMPILEIYVLVQVGQVVGVWWTILLLIAASAAGTWLIRHEGRRAWRALREAIESGRMPAREIADGALIVLGGALMLAPGFVSDALGLLVIVPVTRPVFRRLLAGVVAARLIPGGPGPNAPRPGPRGPGEGPVVRGEVIDD